VSAADAPKPRSCAFFDLDHTLLEGDCGQLWMEFLVARGLVDATGHRLRLAGFYADYQRGALDVHAYTRFQLGTLSGLTRTAADTLRAEYFSQELEPRLRPAAREALLEHRARGELIVIITATNRFLAEPVAEHFEVDALIATDLKVTPEAYVAEIEGEPAFGGGKLRRAHDWCRAESIALADCCFYSDSHNDLPLLEAVGRAVAVTPDDILGQHALKANWPALDWRHTR
jgi:HAD superfamily hydrolase (TIGR01490 family)